jgi:hypothetical protein
MAYFPSSALLSSVARRALVRIAALRRHFDILASALAAETLSEAQFVRAGNWALDALAKAERQLASFASKAALQSLNYGLPAYAWGATLPKTRTQFASNISDALGYPSQYEAVLNPSLAEAWDARYSE